MNLGFGFVILFFILFDGFFLLFLTQTKTVVTRLVDRQYGYSSGVNAINEIVMRIHSDIWDAMLFDTNSRERSVEALNSLAKSFYAGARELRNLSEANRANLDKAESIFRSYYLFGSRILEMPDLETFQARTDEVGQFKKNKNLLIEVLGQVVESSRSDFEKSLGSLNKRFSTAVALSGAATAFLVLASLLVSLFVSRTLTRPISSLEATMKAVEAGDLDCEAAVSTKDEIGTLARSFNDMTRQLKLSRDQMKDQERLKKEMEIAVRIQTALLPENPAHAELDIDALMIPAEEVGGDYYDFCLDQAGDLWISIGDVSGHGLTAGLIMMMAQTAHYDTVFKSRGTRPSEVICSLNKVLNANVARRLKDHSFMTFTSLKYSGDGEFLFAGAHLDMLVHRKGTGRVDAIKTTGTFLSLIDDVSACTRDERFFLGKGDTLLLYTDGVIEAADREGRLLDVPNLCDMLARHSGESVSSLKESIREETMKWCGGNYRDDMTIVVVRRKE